MVIICFTIVFSHRQTGEQNLFAGIITNVSFSGYHGQQNSIIITGASPTIKLAGKPAMDSFMDLPLQQIVNEAVENSGNGAAVTANPKFGSKLDYVCQYNENCWDFLNRLSYQYGEWLMYDGQTTCFGMKFGSGTTLEYDKEMTHFDLSANLSPQKFNRYQYLKHDDKEIDEDDPSDVPGVRGYLQVSKGRSESIYTSDVTAPLIPDINTKKDLNDLVKAEKSRAVGEMLIMRGKTQTCKVKIGETVKIRLPEKMDIPIKSVDTFLVTQITHTIDMEGHYSNSFEGIIDGIEAIPMAEPRLPVAMPQLATVKTNEDERKRGRVKVQTSWQKAKNKTSNWIRVQTPDAGKSDDVPKNRGFVHIPEKDDLVMLGFEFGDPSRPFVMGSMFSELVSEGGGEGNHIKSIRDKSGTEVVMNSKDGSYKVFSPKGQTTFFADGKGNVSISTPNTVSITCSDFKVNTSNSIVLDSKPGKNGGKGTIDATAHKTMSLKTETDNFSVESQTKAISLKAKTDFSASSETASMKLQAAKDAKIESSDTKINASSSIRIKSGDTDVI
ncbi:hypothetical protein FACS189426_21970 [Bacteroidia bacterium]|nr:hypothetical protein FACS189426_21970 [Bacteroidia bacterium]